MIALLLATFSALFAPGNDVISIVSGERISIAEVLWGAVKMVESANDNSIINYTEGAYGCSQIRQIKLTDYNKHTGSKIRLKDCLNEGVSRNIFAWHCTLYSDIELAAMRWNGSGPKTEIYWQKIKKHLNNPTL